MLDLNDPETDLIFKASAYMDKVKFGCQNYILQNFFERQKTFAEMIALCEKLKSFSKTAFSDRYNRIKEEVEIIIFEINRLSEIEIESKNGNCKVCNGEVTIIKSEVKEFKDNTICLNYPSKIYDALNELEMTTGAWQI